jgi:hypothetical protein
MWSTVRRLGVLIARGLGVALLPLVNFFLFGSLAVWMRKPVEFVGHSLSGPSQAMLVLLLSGVALAIVLCYPARMVFGRRFSPLLLALSGLPIALLSIPPDQAALAANGGWVAIVGAMSCTVIVGAVAWLIYYVVDRAPFWRERVSLEND